MIGIGIFGQGTSRWLRILAIFVVGVGTYMAFLEEHQAKLWENYVDVQMESQGAKIRVFMNLIPALFLFALRDRWKIYFKDVITSYSIHYTKLYDEASPTTKTDTTAPNARTRQNP